MPNLMQNAASWLGGQLQTAAGRTVSIRQGAQFVSGITAWMEGKEYQVADAEGFLTSVQACNWTFVRADLDAAGITLREGAIITETLNGVAREYSAMPIGNLPCVEEDFDTSGILLMIHTKRTDE
jgi:hypothetical protein